MATAKTETAVTSVTLTLTEAEAEAVYALSGSVIGGSMTGSPYSVGPERAAADAVFNALKAALGKSVTETSFYNYLDGPSPTVELLPSSPK